MKKESWNNLLLFINMICSPLIAAMAFILLQSAISISGAEYFWDNSTNEGYQIGNGTWGTGNNWTTDGVNLVSWPGVGNSANFSGSEGNFTIIVNGTQNVDSISFNNTEFTLNGGILNFGNKKGIYIAEGKSAKINSIVTGTNGLSFYSGNSLGSIHMEGWNSYTGVTTIGLNVELNLLNVTTGLSTSSIGSSSNSAGNLVVDGGRFRFTGTSAAHTDRLFTLTEKGGKIYSSGSGSLNFTNTGSIVLSGTGARDIELGGLYEGVNLFTPTLADGSGGATSLLKTGPSTWVLAGNNSYSGVTTIDAGTLRIGNGGASGNVSGDIVNNTTVIFNRSDASTLSGVISGAGVVSKEGDGALTLSGANIYTGITTITQGTLIAGHNTALGSTSEGTIVFAGLSSPYPTLALANGVTITGEPVTLNSDQATSARSSLYLAGGDTATWNSTVTLAGDDKTQIYSHGTLNVQGNVNGSCGTLILRGNGQGYLVSTVSIGNTDLDKTDIGTWTISSTANSWRNTWVARGILKIGVSDAIPSTAELKIGQPDESNTSFDLNGYDQTVAGLLDGGTNGGIKSITNSGPSASTLTISNSSDYSYSYLITDGTSSVNVTKSGNGILTLNGVNTYTGVTTINSGTMVIGMNGSLYNSGTFSGSVVINEGATLRIDRQDFWGNHGEIPVAKITVNKNGTLASNGHFNVINDLSLNGGKLFSNGGSSWGTWSLKGTVTVNGTVTSYINTGDGTINNFIHIGNNLSNGAITFYVEDNAEGDDLIVETELRDSRELTQPYPDMASRLIKTGEGTMVLSGTNTYTGPTTVESGTLVINGSTSTASAISVNSGKTLAGTGVAAGPVNIADNGIIAPGEKSPGTLTTGPLILNSNSIVDIELGTLQDSINVNSYLTLDGILNISKLDGFGENTYTLIKYSGTLTDNGIIIGNMPTGFRGELNAGSGLVTLTVTISDETYTWDISIDPGFQAGNGTWGTDGYWTLDGTTLVSWPGAGNSATFAGSNGIYTITVNGTQNTDSIAFLNSGYKLSSGTVNLGTKSGIYVASTEIDTIASVINGSGGLVLYGGGTLGLTGVNTYTGQTIVSSGTIIAKNADAFGSSATGTVVNSGGAVQLEGVTINMESLTLNGTGVSNDGALRNINGTSYWNGDVTLNSAIKVENSATLYLTGTVSGSGNMEKTDTGRVQLNGDNTFTGILIINGRDFVAGHINALGDPSAGTIVNSGYSLVTAANTGLIPNGSIFPEPLTLNGVGLASEGALRMGTGANTNITWGGTINLAANSSIGVPDAGDTLNISGIISNNGALTKVGSGKLVLTNTNSYSGGTTISAGTLQIGNAGITGSITGNVTNGGTLVFNRSDIYEYSGVISSSGTVIQAGSGTLTLSGTNTYTGATNVSAGTLNVTGSIAAASAVTVSGTLAGNGIVAGTVDARNGTIVPGNSGAGSLSTGSLTLGASSILNFELGASRDSIKVNGDLHLAGNLNVTALSGFIQGDYTIITYSGSLVDSGIVIGNLPDGFTGAISASGGIVKLTVRDIGALYNMQFGATPLTGIAPLTVSFTDSSTGDLTDYNWDFGDGNTSTEQNPQHQYKNTGLYSVKLVLNGPDGSDSLVKSDLVFVYSSDDNPVRITSKFISKNDVQIILQNINVIDTLSPSTGADSLGIWIKENSLPVKPVSSKLQIVYGLHELLGQGDFFTDTLTLPSSGVLYGMMTGLYRGDGSISPFTEANGCLVLLSDTVTPVNPFALSGFHLGGDSTAITLKNVSAVDSQLNDSAVICFAGDSASLNIGGASARWLSIREIMEKSQSDSFKTVIHDLIFTSASQKIWCAVAVKGKNDLLSPVVVSSFVLQTLDNPIHLYAEAINSSAIRLYWNRIEDLSINAVRIWISKSAIPTGTIYLSGVESIQLSPADTFCIISSLDYSTRYHFAAQVNKGSVWSPVTDSSRADIVTLNPTDTIPVENTISLQEIVFDSLSAKISVSWCLDTSIDQNLDIGITYSLLSAPQNISDPQIISVLSSCSSAVLRLRESVLFDTTYYVSLWLRKVDGVWSSPTDSSSASIRTPDYSREIITIFNTQVENDTVKAFNGSIVLWKDESFRSTQIRTDTITVYKPEVSYNGMVPVGTPFYFADNDSFHSFFVGIKYDLPSGYSPEQIRMYRDSAGLLLVDYTPQLDSINRIVYTKTSDLRFPFMLFIDSLSPIIALESDTGFIYEPGQGISDTINLSDNIANVTWKYIYGDGDDTAQNAFSGVLNNSNSQINVNIAPQLTDTVNGTRIFLIVSDGVHSDTVNLSRKAWRNRSSEFVTTSIQWYPVTVTTDLDNPEPRQLIQLMAEGDSVFYDSRFMRLCRWVKTDFNTSENRWVEYDKTVSSLFDFIPGRLIWVKTLKDRLVHFDRGATVSLKNDYEIELTANEWTDLGLPFLFNVRMADVLEATSRSDSLQVYRWVKDGVSGRYGTRGLYIPGLPDKENRNVVLDYTGSNGFSIYNTAKTAIVLKIPPVPLAMSPERLSKTTSGSSWSVKLISQTEDGISLPEVYCGYAPGSHANYFPASPSFHPTRAYIYNREQNKRYGHYMGSAFNELLAQEIKFENDSDELVQIGYDLRGIGNLPSGVEGMVLSEGQWKSSGKVSVAAKSSQYKWIVVGDDFSREQFKNKSVSLRYALKSVYPNPFRSMVNIRYTVPLQSNERLKFTVYNALGRLVWNKTVDNAGLGEHIETWRGEDSRGNRVGPGIYFLRLSVTNSQGRVLKNFTSRLTYLP